MQVRDADATAARRTPLTSKLRRAALGTGALATAAIVGLGAASSSAAVQAHATSVTVDGQTISTNAKLAAEVPASVRKQGALVDITYNNAPPDEQVTNG